MTTIVLHGAFVEGTNPDVVAHPRDAIGASLLSANVQSTSRQVFALDAADPSVPIEGPTAITPFLGAPVTGNGWEEDNIGYTMRDTVPFDTIPHQGGRRYRVEYMIVQVGGATHAVVAELQASGMLSTP